MRRYSTIKTIILRKGREMSDARDFMTLREAARELRLSVSTLKRYIYSGQLQTYRTPGGQHRVRSADLAALMGAAPPLLVAESRVIARADGFAEEVATRVDRAIRKRLASLEMEVERLECSIEAISVAARHPLPPPAQTDAPRGTPYGCEIKVLGPGCRACDQLARLVIEIACALGLRREAITRVRELDEIAEYGPTPMPALVVNNQLVSSGRLPSRSRLTELLERCRLGSAQEETH
jgi:excisionase family DNA binding protein